MKSWLLALSMVVATTSLSLAPLEAGAKRLGGGRPAGMQRQLPPRQPDAAPKPPAQPAQGQNAQAAPGVPATPAAAPRRSWMGPIAGLAAGLGLAALFSHFGMGAGLANFVMILLLVAAAVLVLRLVMRRFAGGATSLQRNELGMATAAGSPARSEPTWSATRPAATQLPTESIAPQGLPSHAAAGLPAGVDAADFERIAKMIFIRMQAANDAGEVEDLRKFTTPELFASLRLDLQERGAKAQRTDVVQLEAELLDTAQQDGQYIASVHFHGLLREEVDAPAQPFDEVWHLVRPADGSREWAIAGITPTQDALVPA